MLGMFYFCFSDTSLVTIFQLSLEIQEYVGSCGVWFFLFKHQQLISEEKHELDYQKCWGWGWCYKIDCSPRTLEAIL